MQFLNPAAFWFAFIIPLIIVMYILKPKYREQLISSTFLWDQVIKDIEANRPWQKLKRNLLLILQLLAAFLLIFALSRPYVPLTNNNAHIIAVIDCSASMAATDILPSRFTEAQNQIDNLINTMGYREKMTLIAMGAEPEVVTAASSSKIELHRAVAGLSTGRENANLEPVLEIVRSLSEESSNCLVIIFSDGKTSSVKHDINLDCPVQLKEIGKENANIGLQTLAARQTGRNVIGLAQIHNYGLKETETDLELYVEESLTDVRQIDLKPGETQNVIWDDLTYDAQFIQVKLTDPDCYMADNHAYAVVPQLEKQRVLLVSEGNIFLEKAFGLLSHIDLYKTTPRDYTEDMTDYELWIFDGCWPENLPEGSILSINPPADNRLFPVSGKLEHIQQFDTKVDEGLLQYVDIDNWQIAGSRAVKCPIWCSPLLEYKENLILGIGELDTQKIGVLAFDIHNSNIPLQTGFPILISNLSSWLLPGAARDIQADISDRYFTLAVDPRTELIKIEKDGKEVNQYETPFPVSYPIDTPGLYKIIQQMDAGSELSYLAINQLDGLESDIAPGKLPWSNYNEEKNKKEQRMTNQEIWKYLMWLVLIVLAAEWEVYRRGY